MPGVLIHAQALSQILDQVSGRQALYQFWPNGLEILWLFIWVLMGSTLTWQFRRSWMLILQVGIGLLVTIGTSGFLFSRMVWIPTVEPALGFLLASSISLTHTLLNRMTRDPVTGLLNREMFVRYLNRHIQLSHKSEEHSELTVFFLGIDRFKFINDSMGHYWGDRFLNIIGARLRAYLPKNACLARVGGDEFAVALPLQGIQTAPARADQMQELLATPCELNNQELAATVSVGIAFAPPGYLYNPNDLIRDAHLAMYRAKSMPRSHYELFSVGMREEVVNRLELENDLRKALKAQEFVLYYQPIVCLQTLKIRGFEALVRWKSSTRDLVSPGLFIPLAEETGLILPLGQWILTEACRQVKQWQVQFPDDTPLMMSINLSGRQFDQTNLAEQVEAALSEFQIDPRSIKLEITESMVMQDTQSAIDQMLRLKALNLKLGIDDFGTGYSSLSYMQRFPVDTLKIDRSFVNEMQDSPSGLAIVRTIITLAHELGMDAIAEGIETEFELKALQNLQCEFAQGFLLSKPLSSSDATKLLTLQFEGKEPLRQRKKS
ncbi:MAG: putative bifunctional diguanylate cyclase/phosphodiesterase [Prochlorotrichaceae cyanobacterium]